MRGEMRSDPQRHHPGALARLALIAFGVIVALAIVVGFVLLKADDWAVFTDPARDGVRVAYYRDDADLGYGPLPGRTVRARKTVAGRVIYDVLYTIDDDGGRATPGDPQGRSFLFFGDSCTFGEGVGDNETMPAAFASELGGRANVRNLGFHGYGPHQTVRELELERIEKLVPGGVAHAFYMSLPSHGSRAAGRSPWDVSGPRYVLDDADGSGSAVRYKGSFHAYPVALLLRGINRVPPLRKLRERWLMTEPGDDERELHARLLARAAALVRTRFDAPFTVLHWDDGSPADERFLARLDQLGIDVVRVSTIIPHDQRSALAIPGDGHPNQTAYALLAHALALRTAR